MNATTALKDKKCKPCEGETEPLAKDEAQKLLKDVDGWQLVDDGKKIQRKWTVKNFVAGIDFLSKVAGVMSVLLGSR